MFRVNLASPQPVETLDLETIRETLVYMHGDLEGQPGLEGAAEHLKSALTEIEAEQKRRRKRPGAKVTIKRFVPWLA